ncbi:MAG: DUF427 domain-containing protein [Acidobacteria bacterium]|nr:MAG: DUF427 domain-containing protein [Acidobacteriota bacterium]REK11306.1 MAG: DUF427 domain-containing protein [Acidobacteriota bacterium]
MWEYDGRRRPVFAVEPGAGQESVWDYPRPPRIEAERRLVTVDFGGRRLARSERAWRVLETASPPTVYLPRRDVDLSLLEPAPGRSRCEWKGTASYWRLHAGFDLPAAGGAEAAADSGPVAWSYEDPTPAFRELAGTLSFYPSRVTCRLGGEVVRPQAGGFYGGWVTDEIVGPFKGDPGTGGW